MAAHWSNSPKPRPADAAMTQIHLYTHALMTENIALYRRIGFIETHRVSEKGYDRVYMTKQLHGVPGTAAM